MVNEEVKERQPFSIVLKRDIFLKWMFTKKLFCLSWLIEPILAHLTFEG